MTIPEAGQEVLDKFALPPYELPPELINQGNCWMFAKKVRLRCPGIEIIGDSRCAPEDIRHVANVGHVWIYNPGAETHHDAECLDGVDNYRSLPFFCRPDLNAQRS